MDKVNDEYININEHSKNITGAILKKENLKYFSVKFYQALLDIEDNLFMNNHKKNGKNKNNEKNESRTGFVYSNLVKIGIELFQEILLQNGYLQYDENKNNYLINDNTICYKCGGIHKDHDINDNTHVFEPATFLVVTGQSNEEIAEVMPENNKKIITNIFNNYDNREGKNIKLILGSKVMNELNGTVISAERPVMETELLSNSFKEFGPSVRLNIQNQEAFKGLGFTKGFSEFSSRDDYGLLRWLIEYGTLARTKKL